MTRLAFAAAVVLVLAVAAAPAAVRAEDAPALQVHGLLWTGLGQANYDASQGFAVPGGQDFSTNSHSELVGTYEARVKLLFFEGQTLSGKVVLLPRGSASASTGNESPFNNTNSAAPASDVYAEAAWQPVQPLIVTLGRLEGPEWGDPLSTNYPHVSPLGAPPEFWMAWTGANGGDVSYRFGALQAGLGVSSQCLPSCGSVAVIVPGAGGPPVAYNTYGSTSLPNENTATLAPHLGGSFGSLSFRVMAPQTSGTVYTAATASTAAQTINTSGSGYQAGLRWQAAPALALAADAQAFTDDKATGGTHAFTRTGTGFKVELGGMEVVAHQLDYDGGSAPTRFTNTQVRVSYGFAAGVGQVIPEVVQYTLGKRKLATNGAPPGDATDSLARLTLRFFF
ncbi:MAG TPA: hypothetical protein VL359_02695 [bacterium]|nr:hypothetical protein [bacterium]